MGFFGAQNSANIIVQNRITGQLEEEKMQVYVRLGIRLLYKVRFSLTFALKESMLIIATGCKRQDGGCTRWVIFRPFAFQPDGIDADRGASTARKLLKSMSIKQGRKYDSPESAADIRSFIQFHNLNVSEIRDPIDSFSAIFSHLL